VQKIFQLILMFADGSIGQYDRFLHSGRIKLVIMHASHPRIPDDLVMLHARERPCLCYLNYCLYVFSFF
jgi:hypothetical protein